VLVYHDWGRLNVTFNVVRETALQSPHGNDYGYAWGLFVKRAEMGGSMPGMAGTAGPPVFSMSRVGYGMEMFGALGDSHRFGIDWNAQQHYLGAVITYFISPRSSVRLSPTFGLSRVSDPFMLRTAVSLMLGPSNH
jgi:hypothetical protein